MLTDVPQVRKFRTGRKYELDLKSPDESAINIRQEHLQRTNHYTRVIKKVIDGVLHYLLYKSKKSTYYRYHPLSGRLGL